MADRTPRRVSEGDRLLRTLFDYIDRRIRELLPFVTPEGKLNLNSRDIVGQLPGKSGGTSGSVGVSIRGARDYDDRVAPATGQAVTWDGTAYHPDDPTPAAHHATHESGGPDAFTGVVPGAAFAPSGLIGATAASRYVGATASGAPATGTFAKGDWIIDQGGSAWVCTTAGAPGTWAQLAGGGGTNYQTIQDDGAALTPRPALDIRLPAGGTLTDDSAHARTILDLSTISGGGGGGATLPRAHVSGTSTAIPPSANTALAFATIVEDNAGQFSSGQPTRLTCEKAGTYFAWAEVALPNGTFGGSNGDRIAAINKNGAGVGIQDARQATGTNSDYTATPTGIVALVVGDYLEVYAYQNSGAMITPSEARFGMVKIADTEGGSALPWVNVKDHGATGDGTTDDTAAITAAIGALNTAGRGVLYFPAGTYKTSGGFTLSAPCLVRGDGMVPGSNGSVTAIQCDSATAALFTVTAPGADFRDLELWNTAATTPTAGAGIVVSNATISPRVNYDHVEVYGFYDNFDIQTGDGWAMRGCVSVEPVRYAARIRNTINPDTGDWAIADSTFWGTLHGAAALLRLESSGGGKVLNCKFNGSGIRPQRAIDVAPAATTSILLIGNCSIENYTGDGIHLAGGGWDDIVIHGCEFGQYFNGTGHAVAVSSLDDVVVDACVFRTDSGAASAVSLTAVARAYIGAATNNGFGAIVTQSGSIGVIDMSGGAASPPDATASAKGILQLAGDLAGTAASPALAALSPDPSGTYTLATLTVDAKGRVTAAADGAAVTAEMFGVVFNNAGDVALKNDGTIATKRK